MAPRLRAFLVPLLLPLALYLGICLLMFLTQRSQIYFPVRESSAPGATAMRLALDGAEIKVWAVERPGRAALLYFGGNAEDVGASIGRFAGRLPAHSLYFVNYRGYGGSGGSPSERALVDDAFALYDRLRARHGEISVVGRSLGSGVAVRLASEREVLMRDRFDSASLAPAIAAETLVVIAGEDEIIPRARSEALVAAFRDRPRVVVLEGSGHNDIDLDPQYLDELAKFLSR
jgi:pimeloyl-ACP methyl ester carboxylesterase